MRPITVYDRTAFKVLDQLLDNFAIRLVLKITYRKGDTGCTKTLTI